MKDYCFKILLLGLFVFVLSGCASTNIISADVIDDSLLSAATDPYDIKIVREEPDPNIYVKLGEISAKGASKTTIEDAMRRKASQWGADLLYIVDEPELFSEEAVSSGKGYESPIRPVDIKVTVAQAFKKKL
ncbi:MAG: hypothetical protein GF375_01545 [Candidatus Omnitrophica bacterium]|nr:hypothetical protein [Candidatus Omnitrophota bacterium]MBD3268812.1 hypothetical protein [Candidatus Omnitrophota bacterium]